MEGCGLGLLTRAAVKDRRMRTVERVLINTVVRFRGQTGKHLLVLGFAGFDPMRSKAGSTVSQRSEPLTVGTSLYHYWGD
jgi:hypothetical protein